MLPLSFVATAALLAQSAGPSDKDKADIAYLRTLQTPSGGFVNALPATGAAPAPSLRITRTGLRAFRLLHGSPADRDGVIRFLKACHDPKTGGFADGPGAKPDAISTSVALMAFDELKIPTADYLDPALKFMGTSAAGFEDIRMVAPALEVTGKRIPRADDWLKLIDKERNPDGSYGKGPGRARTTALYFVCQQRLGGKAESDAVVAEILKAGQRADGGYGNDTEGASDLESCYRVERAFSRLNAQPAHADKLRAFLESCRTPTGGYGVRPGAPRTLQGTYYAAIIRSWLDGQKAQ